MKDITLLLDQNFITDFFNKRILPQYPNFTSIKNIEIKAHKKYIWPNSHHIVLEYITNFHTSIGDTKTISIFTTSHSKESREHVYKSLNFLWENGFNNPNTTIPHALYYSRKFNACFYEGINGPTLYQLIKEQDVTRIKKLLPQVALWFSKLHSIKEPTHNYKLHKSTIETVIPGKAHILNTIKTIEPKIYPIFKKIFTHVIDFEKSQLTQTNNLKAVHGDAHPENIIRISENKMGIIDFTDLCITDFARDLGTFTQQLEYMSTRKLNDPKISQELSNIFLNHYFKYAKINKDSNVEARIKNYYHWTTIRTATYFLTQGNLITIPEYRQKAIKLIKETEEQIQH